MVDQFVERSKNSHFSPAILKFLGVLEQHVEKRRVSKVDRFEQFFELSKGHDASSIEVKYLGDLSTSEVFFKSACKLVLGELLNLWRLRE